MNDMRCYVDTQCLLHIDNKSLFKEIVDLFYYNYFKGWMLEEECKRFGYIILCKDKTEWY